MDKHHLNSAYAECMRLASTHYENFPVASWALPKWARKPVAAIYAFARRADDIADEGHLTESERLEQLTEYEQNLKALEQGEPARNPLFLALSDTIQRYKLPYALFYDLLTAFKQDVTKKRYQTFEEVLNYCRYSANPVGRLMLILFKYDTPQNLKDADAICTALQLINFVQDVASDFDERGRIYMPMQDMAKHQVTEAHFAHHKNSKGMYFLMQEATQRAEDLLHRGQGLCARLDGRFGLEIKLIVAGGQQIINKCKQRERNLFARPKLGTMDGCAVLWRALAKSYEKDPQHDKASEESRV